MNSRFITTLSPAKNSEEAHSLIERVRKEFHDADHHVTAFILGHGTSQVAHCSDGGEPSGSAGRPTLAVLQGSGLGDVVVVVTRYFGGTKLGIGGLVRAYGDAVRCTIQDVPIASKIHAASISLIYSYPLVERMRQLVSFHNGQIRSEEFGLEVAMIAYIPQKDLPAFEVELAELTKGQVKLNIIEVVEILLPIKNRY